MYKQSGPMSRASGPRLLPEFASLPVIARETQLFESKCACTKRIEAGRAALHASLDRVLVIDMRMMWNGIGNSLTRWLAVLRLGTAAGRATFLWMSDRDHPNPGSHSRRRLRGLGARPTNWRKKHTVARPRGFDLGDYFVAVGGDYRWSRAVYRRVVATQRG